MEIDARKNNEVKVGSREHENATQKEEVVIPKLLIEERLGVEVLEEVVMNFESYFIKIHEELVATFYRQISTKF